MNICDFLNRDLEPTKHLCQNDSKPTMTLNFLKAFVANASFPVCMGPNLNKYSKLQRQGKPEYVL